MVNDQSQHPDILIVGASVRAAAESARRAGLTPICADLFADEDLCDIAQVVRVESYPRDLPAVAAGIPPCPWMYTGALENRPDIIAEISNERTLWGNPPASIVAVRDPFKVANALRSAGLPFADVRLEPQGPPRDGTWVVKPLRSAGGRGIQVWDAEARSLSLRESHYFQRRLSGIAYSAVYIATSRKAHLVGISRQLVGESSLGATAFTYCGSIGPVSLHPTIEEEMEQAGECATRLGQLRGIFGIDFVCDDRRAVVVEINPRYTASIEVIERAHDLALIDWHRRACESFHDVQQSQLLDEQIARNLLGFQNEMPAQVVGKAIVFADKRLVTRSLKSASGEISAGRSLVIADRPAPNTEIATGQPICTLLVEGKTCDECQTGLVESSLALREWLSRGKDKT
jgi:predicted ATP-grasp superfamily ATP-dependent carboligase